MASRSLNEGQSLHGIPWRHVYPVTRLAVGIALAILLSGIIAQGTVTTFTTAGNMTWTCPAGVTSVQVECWGGGGGGGGVGKDYNVGGGGAGGSYVRHTITPVTPGTTYN